MYDSIAYLHAVNLPVCVNCNSSQEHSAFRSVFTADKTYVSQIVGLVEKDFFVDQYSLGLYRGQILCKSAFI